MPAASHHPAPPACSEGGIWATLFGLLLWDALFAPVPDAFRTPFQTAPLDLSDPSFYPARQASLFASRRLFSLPACSLLLACGACLRCLLASLLTPRPTPPPHTRTHARSPQDVIEACLARIAAGEAPSLLQAAWDAHRGTLCRGVSWDRHPLPELQTVAECVGGPALAAVCRLLARDHAGWQGARC